MPTPTLIEQVRAGKNGTRIYEFAGVYYAIDGEIDCRQDRAGDDLRQLAHTWDRELDRLRQRVGGR